MSCAGCCWLLLAAASSQQPEMVATLINGMSVALYTTLVGAVLYVWLIINHRLLTSGVVSLIGAIIELGEARERA